MTDEMDVKLERILARLRLMDETMTEIHRIVMGLHEQWNTPSSMEIPEEALKEKDKPIGEPDDKSVRW